jgi:predicted nuclease of restriction endonuclease-like (RecB) superfamily
MNEIINQDFKIVIDLIQKSRYNALKSVNTELINLYWHVGKLVSEKVNFEKWGKSVVNDLSDFIRNELPGIKGFSSQNIWRMMQFYNYYKDFPKLSTLLRELSWSSNHHILSKTKSIEEKEFYLSLAIREKYSVRELERQIDSAYYERTILSSKSSEKLSTQLTENEKLSIPLREIQSHFKDTYIFEFLDLPEPYSENDLQKGLIANLKKFILELGRDFAFVGEYYRVQVGGYDYYIDLVFFHRELRALVAIELKIDDFKPEYMGKMEFYLEALDREYRKPDENQSIGIILCKSKDSEVVEFAMSRSLSPAMVAEYETKLIDKKLLKAKLHELYEMLDSGKEE